MLTFSQPPCVFKASVVTDVTHRSVVTHMHAKMEPCTQAAHIREHSDVCTQAQIGLLN